ncbi:MAG: beta-ketoacyl synthase [Planctomycetes bacterium]|nr:beta-ketoacyl synthase [Planctomycetota bacterium]
MADLARIVITGVGLTSPNGNSLAKYRSNLLSGVSGVSPWEIRHFGKTVAGQCDFEATRYQTRKALRRGTRAGSIAIFCAHEAVTAAQMDLDKLGRDRVGVYVGTTEHGNVETEQQIHEVSQYDFDLSFWSHHHNPRTVANNPAGEVTLSLPVTGPHYSVGGACAGGNLGLIQGAQMLQLHEVDMALAGGVSESIHTFGIFASFKSEGALGQHEDPTQVSRPFDKGRNGIVVSEGGCLFAMERLEDAQRRSAPILAEVLGWQVNSDATDFVLPNPERQNQCMRGAIQRAGLQAEDIHIVNTHSTSTPLGDVQECRAINEVFGDSAKTSINNTKSFIGHTMGAAGALELAGNLPSFQDGWVHPTINVPDLDPECAMRGLVLEEPHKNEQVETILNLSFGMLGINSAVIVGRPPS